MKKCLSIVCLCTLLLLSACRASTPESPKGQPSVPQKAASPALSVYTLTREAYYAFIGSPSAAALAERHADACVTYTAPAEAPGTIRVSRVKDGSLTHETADEGIVRIDTVRVFRTLIDGCGTTEAVEGMLNFYGYDITVRETAMLYTAGLPATVAADTDGGTYLLTVRENTNGTDGEYLYEVYTPAQYAERFAVGEGTLIIDEENRLTVTMHADYAEIPLVAVMKTLGAKIISEGKVIRILYNDVPVALDAQEETYNGTPFYDLVPVFTETEAVMTDENAQNVLALWGITLSVDHENRKIRLGGYIPGDPDEWVRIVPDGNGHYACTVFSQDGNILYEKTDYWYTPQARWAQPSIVEVYNPDDAGIMVSSAVYCDIENGRVSEEFRFVLGIQGDYVVFLEPHRSYVNVAFQKMFDEEKQQAFELPRCGPSTTAVTAVAFAEDGTVSITYRVVDTKQTNTLTFSLYD